MRGSLDPNQESMVTALAREIVSTGRSDRVDVWMAGVRARVEQLAAGALSRSERRDLERIARARAEAVALLGRRLRDVVGGAGSGGAG